jgi:hypothetical protein
MTKNQERMQYMDASYGLRRVMVSSQMRRQYGYSEHRPMDFALDAPDWMPAGCVTNYGMFEFPIQRQIVRGE